MTWEILGRAYGMTAEDITNSSLTQRQFVAVIGSLPLLQVVHPFEGLIFGQGQQSVPSKIGFTPY